MQPVVIVLAALLSANPAPELMGPPAPGTTLSEAIVQESAAAVAATAPDFLEGPPRPSLGYVIDVETWRNPELIRPDYPRDPDTWLGIPFGVFAPFKDMIGVERGGSAGSPSFDPVLRKYWWE